MRYLFEGGSLDTATRELRRGPDVVAVEPQVFDLLQFLIENRERVVSKDELLGEVWNGRVVSESTLSSRITAVRHAVGDSGEAQRLVRTIARKGLRFVGAVREEVRSDNAAAGASPVAANDRSRAATGEPDVAERRYLTIAACELVMDTMAHVDPEELRNCFGRYYRCVDAIVARAGGLIAKYAGGSLLIYFGYPHAHEDDAERAVRAMLAALTALHDIGTSGARLHARVGIDTGLVVVGELAETGGATAAIGDPPQIAARLAAIGAPDALVISAATRALIGHLFDYRDLGIVHANGNTLPVAAAEVLRESGVASRFEALRSRRAPLIGRDEEVELLLRRWNQVRTGEGRVVLIWGEPGIGKSHLVTAFQDRLEPPPPSFRYYCLPHRTETALHPVIAQLEHAAEFTSTDDDAAKLHKIERLVAPFSRDPARDIALIAELMSIPVGDAYSPLALSPERRKELLFDCLTTRLAALATRQPVLILLEDAHWIDPTTRELFDIFIERIHDLPALLVLTYRPQFKPACLGQSHVTALTLSRLGRRDNAALVTSIAGGRALPPVLLEQILNRTDGVPLFIEEVTKSVLEGGLLRDEGGAYVLAAPLPERTVPTTLHASLVARFDRLAPARALVQTTAAVGREFTYAMAKAVSGLSDAVLEPQLDQLVASELVHQRGQVPHAMYAFKHALVQDAAYATMLHSQRIAVHRRIADVLEREFPEAAQRHPDVLAHHCTAGEEWERAIDFRIKANRMALDRSAGVEAQAQVEQGFALLPQVAAAPAAQQLEGRLQVALGDALSMTHGFAAPGVMAALVRARSLLDETLHPIESLRALCGLFNFHLIRSESPQCLALAEPLLSHDADRRIVTVAHYLVGTAHLHLGNFHRSIGHLETALGQYDERVCEGVAFVAGYHVRSFTLIWLGLGYLYTGAMQRAAQTIEAAVADARRRVHPFTLVSALLALARFRSHVHDHDGAVAATEEGLAIAAEQRSPYHLSRGRILRALNLIDGNRPLDGITQMERALEAHRATGANFQSSYNLSRLADAHAHAGNLEAALALADEAIADGRRSGEQWWEAEAQRRRGEILLLASPPDRAEAEASFQRALACARRQQAALWELGAARSLAELWSTEGRRSEAHALLAPVCARFSDGFAFEDLRRAQESLRTFA